MTIGLSYVGQAFRPVSGVPSGAMYSWPPRTAEPLRIQNRVASPTMLSTAMVGLGRARQAGMPAPPQGHLPHRKGWNASPQFNVDKRASPAADHFRPRTSTYTAARITAPFTMYW
jgi:hypothetical protein